MNLKLGYAVLITALVSFSLQWWQPDFLYVRQAVSQGEWWRLLSGQFVHTNWPHFALNIGSLILFAALFYTTVRVRTFTISLFLLAISVGICLYVLEPRIRWYAGLSGAIYGLFLIGAYSAYRSDDRLIAVGVFVIIIGKTLIDHWGEPLHSNAELIGARVVTEAHIYGILSALCLCGLDAIYRCVKPDKDPDKSRSKD